MVYVLCGNRSFTLENGRRRTGFVRLATGLQIRCYRMVDGGCALWESEFHIGQKSQPFRTDGLYGKGVWGDVFRCNSKLFFLTVEVKTFTTKKSQQFRTDGIYGKGVLIILVKMCFGILVPFVHTYMNFKFLHKHNGIHSHYRNLYVKS